MKTIFSFEDLYQEYERTHSEIETLENFYQNYDSHIIQEDLNFSGLRAFFNKNITSPGWVATYNYDDKGITTFIISLAKKVYRHSIITNGYVVVRNLKGSYDIHEFWRS